MIEPVKYIAASSLFVFVAGCASTTENPTPQPSKTDPIEQAYQECLQENMAVSMAWEAIEQMCRDQVSRPTGLLPDQP